MFSITRPRLCLAAASRKGDVAAMEWEYVMGVSLLSMVEPCRRPFRAERSPWHSVHVPPVGIVAYVHRLRRQLSLDGDTLVVACQLATRFVQAASVEISALTIHRVAFIAIMIARKWHNDDNPYTLGFYCKAGGLPPNEALTLELAFLSAISFRAHVSWADFTYRREAMWACGCFFSWNELPATAHQEQAKIQGTSRRHLRHF